MNVLFKRILIVICVFLAGCKPRKERDFWLLQDEFAYHKKKPIMNTSKYMKLSKRSSLMQYNKSYYRVYNLFEIDRLDGYIAFDSARYFFVSDIDNKEYLLFDDLNNISSTRTIIPIDTITSIKISFLSTCNLDSVYGSLKDVGAFNVSLLIYGKRQTGGSLCNVYIKNNEMLAQSYCGLLLSCYLYNYMKGDIDTTGIYRPCDTYREKYFW